MRRLEDRLGINVFRRGIQSFWLGAFLLAVPIVGHAGEFTLVLDLPATTVDARESAKANESVFPELKVQFSDGVNGKRDASVAPSGLIGRDDVRQVKAIPYQLVELARGEITEDQRGQVLRLSGRVLVEGRKGTVIPYDFKLETDLAKADGDGRVTVEIEAIRPGETRPSVQTSLAGWIEGGVQ